MVTRGIKNAYLSVAVYNSLYGKPLKTGGYGDVLGGMTGAKRVFDSVAA